MRRHAPPSYIPAGWNVVVRAFPYRSPYDGRQLWFRYDLWVVADEAWTGQLTLMEADARLRALGLSSNAASGRLRQVRRRLKREIDEGRYPAHIRVYPVDDP